MKLRRTIAGGLVLLGIAIAGYFNSLFRGPGFGGHESGENGLPVITSRDQSNAESAAPKPDEAESVQIVSQSAKVVEILIDGRNYLVREGKDGEHQYRPIELPELLEVVQQAPGNEEGIRVRISRTESSRASAEHRLDQELRQIGVAKSAIDRNDELLP